MIGRWRRSSETSRHESTVAKRQWFARRRYGFGVRPMTWQGWLITAIAVGGAVGALAGVQKTAGEILLVGVSAVPRGKLSLIVARAARTTTPSLRTVPRK